MENNQHLFEVIDELFISHAGPIAHIICEEAKEQWNEEGNQINFASMAKYIKLLLDELPTDKTKQEFLNSIKTTPSTQQIIK